MSNKTQTPNPYASHENLGLMQGFPPPACNRVDTSNAVFGSPQNRWSYQNMRMLFPSAGVANSAQSMPIELAIDGGIKDLQISRENGQVADFNTFLEETYTDSLIVLKGQKMVFEHYLNGMHAGQPHQMMSVTKSFAGLFGLMAVDQGLMRETDLISDIVPELAGSGAFGDATFRQVLDMTNSMDFSEDYTDPNAEIMQYGKVLGWLEAHRSELCADNMYDYLVTLPKDPACKHGEVFRYQTPKADVVNWATNRATGKSFQQNLYDKLWSKLGTDGETYVLLDRNATLVAGGGLNATPHDLARFAMMMLNDGEFNGQQIVWPEVIQDIAEGASRDAFSNGPEAMGLMGNGDWSYRAQWWVRHTPGHEAICAIGIHGQWIYIDLIHDVAIIKQSSQKESYANEQDAFNINAFDAIISYLTS